MQSGIGYQGWHEWACHYLLFVVRGIVDFITVLIIAPVVGIRVSIEDPGGNLQLVW